MAEKWYPAALPEKGVVGYFEYFEIIDAPASLAADEERYKNAIVCYTKASGSSDVSAVKVKEGNQRELVRRFPEAWAAFQGEEVNIDGTPLSDLGIPDQRITEFQLNGVLSVEQLAELSDIACQNIGFGVRRQRGEAQDYLKDGKAGLAANKIANGSDPVKKKGGRPKGSKNKPHVEAGATAA
jgi:hypothetical protein